MKNIGVWLDKERAHVVTLTEKGENFKTILSELEFFNPKGGSRSEAKWGPQDVVQDSKYLEREKHQLRRYFQNIADTIDAADSIALFGPGDTNDKFKKELKENYPLLDQKVKTVTKVDSMTDNQVKALVRDYFNH